MRRRRDQQKEEREGRRADNERADCLKRREAGHRTDSTRERRHVGESPCCKSGVNCKFGAKKRQAQPTNARNAPPKQQQHAQVTTNKPCLFQPNKSRGEPAIRLLLCLSGLLDLLSLLSDSRLLLSLLSESRVCLFLPVVALSSCRNRSIGARRLFSLSLSLHIITLSGQNLGFDSVNCRTLSCFQSKSRIKLQN